MVQASRIIGESVENNQQEERGKLFAMPWTAFDVSTSENMLILDMNKDMLENAPGFE